MSLNLKFIIWLFTLCFLPSICFASGYEYSPDGSDVACGKEYSSYAYSPDGSSVCCGGRYSSYAYSPDGSDVCFGWESD